MTYKGIGEYRAITLTTGADNIVGTAGNDVIDGGIADSWSSFDKIDGGSGDDTMTVLVTGTSAPGGISLTNVETLNVNTTAASYTIDTTGYTGLTALNLSSSTAGPISVTGATTTAAQVLGAGNSTVDVIGTGGNLFVQTGAAAVTVGGTAVANALTSASVKGGSTVAITDRSGAGATTGTKLESVSLDGNTDAATITANGLTNLKVANTNQNATVAAAAGSRDLAVTLDTVTGGTISDNEATSLSVTASGGNSTGVTLDAAKATTVSVTANKNLTVADVNINAATGITVAGAGDFTLSAASNVGALTGIDASSATGNVTITPTLGAAVGYTGGSGKDSITVGATTKAITTGAGDDTVTVADGVTALGAGGSLDGGEGIDTLAFATYANAVTASATATFANSISGFEKLKINGANGVANATINLANLDGINDVEIAGNRTATTTISNLLSNGTVTFSVDQTNDQALTVAVKNAATGTDDVVNIGLKGTAAVGSNSITVNDVETINFVTDDTAATITNINHSSS